MEFIFGFGFNPCEKIAMLIFFVGNLLPLLPLLTMKLKNGPFGLLVAFFYREKALIKIA